MAGDAVKPDIRPYVVRMYDRWIILAIILVLAWFARPIFAYSLFYRGVTFEHMLVFSSAERYYQKSIRVYDRIPQGWVGLGELYMMRAQGSKQMYANAVDTFATGLALNPDQSRFWDWLLGGPYIFQLAFDLARTYYEGHDYRAALAACDHALQLEPSNRFALDYAAHAAYNLGNRKLALAYWHRLLGLYPTDRPTIETLRRLGG